MEDDGGFKEERDSTRKQRDQLRLSANMGRSGDQ